MFSFYGNMLGDISKGGKRCSLLHVLLSRKPQDHPKSAKK